MQVQYDYRVHLEKITSKALADESIFNAGGATAWISPLRRTAVGVYSISNDHKRSYAESIIVMSPSHATGLEESML
jgi:hypothetical protein